MGVPSLGLRKTLLLSVLFHVGQKKAPPKRGWGLVQHLSGLSRSA
jgi:hypothetical protein